MGFYVPGFDDREVGDGFRDLPPPKVRPPETDPPPAEVYPAATVTEEEVADLEAQARLAARAGAARAVLVRNHILRRVLDGTLELQPKDVAALLRAVTPRAEADPSDDPAAGAPPAGLLLALAGNEGSAGGLS